MGKKKKGERNIALREEGTDSVETLNRILRCLGSACGMSLSHILNKYSRFRTHALAELNN